MPGKKIEIIRSQEFMPSEARLKFLKKMIILGPKTAILGPQFCRILVLGPQFWWSGGARAPGAPLDPALITLSCLTISSLMFFGYKTRKRVVAVNHIKLLKMMFRIYYFRSSTHEYGQVGRCTVCTVHFVHSMFNTCYTTDITECYVTKIAERVVAMRLQTKI